MSNPDSGWRKHEKEKRTLDIVNIKDGKNKINDLEVVGNGDMFKLLCKASSKEQGWMKSTKACEIPSLGCIVQVTTQQGDNIAEAITFVPGVRILEDINGGNKLEKDYSMISTKTLPR